MLWFTKRRKEAKERKAKADEALRVAEEKLAETEATARQMIIEVKKAADHRSRNRIAPAIIEAVRRAR